MDDTTPDARAQQPYHLFDAAMRSWGESNPAGVAAWLDPTLSGADPASVRKRSAALHDPLLEAPVLHLDLVLSIGSQRVMHVEYETSPRRGLVNRMFDYRARIKREHPDRRLTQHVIVLGEGKVKGYDEREPNEFFLNLHPVLLREHEPDRYLADPFLAPLAALARGSPQEREQTLRAALRLLAASEHPLARIWFLAANSLALVHFDRSTIDRLRREEGVSVHPYVDFLRDDPIGRALIEEGHDQGRAEGAAQGQERTLLSLLRHRFGAGAEIATVARVLSAWEDTDAAVAAIAAATDPAALLALPAPPPRP